MGSSSSKIPPEYSHLAKTTHFKKVHLKQLYDDFMKSVPSGKMTAEEFKKYYQKLAPSLRVDEYTPFLFKAFDSKSRKYLDFEDFAVGFSRYLRGPKDEKKEWSFTVYDQNRNGKLTYDDILVVQLVVSKMLCEGTFSEKERKMTESTCQDSFGLLNKDYKVDTINLKEFKRVAEKERLLMLSSF